MVTDLQEYLEKLMVKVKGGTFMMGSNEGNYGNEKPVHEVELDDFYIAKYLVTQELYEFVIGENPSYFKGKQRPVENVDWYDAIEFCNLLSEKAGLNPYYTIDKSTKDPNNENEYDNKKWLVLRNEGENGFRLSTEAEWEYAARGGKAYWEEGLAFAGNKVLNEVGWYNENSHEETKPVGLKQPNKLGLYDMSGNVWEWCWDWYDGNYYQNSLKKNPDGAKKGELRVLRGGSWNYNDDLSRVANRLGINPNYRFNYGGFRLSRA